jgi:hypothetical protein
MASEKEGTILRLSEEVERLKGGMKVSKAEFSEFLTEIQDEIKVSWRGEEKFEDRSRGLIFTILRDMSAGKMSLDDAVRLSKAFEKRFEVSTTMPEFSSSGSRIIDRGMDLGLVSSVGWERKWDIVGSHDDYISPSGHYYEPPPEDYTWHDIPKGPYHLSIKGFLFYQCLFGEISERGLLSDLEGTL